jgi:GGDEF domain-containing protein
MAAQELAVWCMALGAVAAIGLARLAGAFMRPSMAQAQGVAYHLAVFLLILLLSGAGAEIWPSLDGLKFHYAQVLAGPICVGLSNFWIRGWLNAAQRDRAMSLALRASSLSLPVAAVACLALPVSQQVPAAAALSLAGGALTLWVTVRAGLLGDGLAPLMATGCLLTLPAIAGMHAIAMDLPLSLPVHAAFAFCAVLSNGFTGFVLWRRDLHERSTHYTGGPSSHLDAVTRLDSGIGLVRKLVDAQRRRRRTRRDGAVLAILVFDIDRIAAQVGTAGVNEMFIRIAGRIQRQVGAVNPVGRYYDRCFVTLVEAIHSPAWLRTLGLRVASHSRRPIQITAATGERAEVIADVGVGIVHLSGSTQAVEDVLHDAQRLAEAARGMQSRAAILDPRTGKIVPVEQASLEPQRRPHNRAASRAT